MNKQEVVRVHDISKTFYVRQKSVNNIRDSILRPKRLVAKKNTVRALQNINFTVNQGDVIGIIGRNGSGKSTLLNLLMGSIRADKGGYIKTEGRLIRLALGMGFDPNLTARHNIYVNGSILGLTFKKIGLLFDKIISFADLHDFVDTPLKFYSSGMRVRLSFAIAIHAQADIYLLDEIFGGVGDEAFRIKSQKVFENTFLTDSTVIFVSHSLANIEKFSHKVLLLDKGRQVFFGAPNEAIEHYRKIVSKSN